MPSRARNFGNPDGVLEGTLEADTAADFPHRLGRVPAIVLAVPVAATVVVADITWDRDASDAENIRLIANNACDFVAICMLD